MRRACFLRAGAVLLLLALHSRAPAGQNVLPHTQPLAGPSDFSAQMVAGMDAFLLREGEDPEQALTGFHDFSEVYQASVTQPQPLFRRRLG